VSNDRHLRCSFCGKSKDAVRKFISGPSVYICNECIALCNEILQEDEEREVAEAIKEVPTPSEIKVALSGFPSSGARRQAVEDLFDVGGRATLARQDARDCNPLPLRFAEGLDRRREELPRLAGAQGSATCSGSRPLALSLSIG